MSREQEHELVPAIRGWLSSTRDSAISVGLSRDQSDRQAVEFLKAGPGAEVPWGLCLDSEGLDVLWALTSELGKRPFGIETFNICDHLYQQLSNYSLEGDYLGERNELLHRIARTGWKSAAGGLPRVLNERARIWTRIDSDRLRQASQSVDSLAGRIEKLSDREMPAVEDLLDLCSQLLRLGEFHPRRISALAETVRSFVRSSRVGPLDCSAFLTGMASLALGFSNRILGNWAVAASAYDTAENAFDQTCDRAQLGSIAVERIALLHGQLDYAGVVGAASLIESLASERDRVKVNLILASSLNELGQPAKAIEILEPIVGGPVLDAEREPVLLIYALIRLGSAFSKVGNMPAAVERFMAAFTLIARSEWRSQLANLTACIGESFSQGGRLSEAAALYGAAREMFLEAEQPHCAAYVSVLLAEVLILLGRETEARGELLRILPLMEERRLEKEAYSAVVLLLELTSKQRSDLKAIRKLKDRIWSELS